MKWAIPVLVAVIAACSPASSTSGTNPIITGDACALHQDAVSCRSDPQGCVWYANTRPCQVDQPCPAGWCSGRQPLDGGSAGDGGLSASAGCACPGASDEVCEKQIGGPAMQVEPPITCTVIPSGCLSPDRCACLAQGGLERCWSSDQVANLCICDNGIR